MEKNELPTRLMIRCRRLGVDIEKIEDVLAEPSEPGGEWIVKVDDDLPYATIGNDYNTHVSYQDALNHSIDIQMNTRILKAVDRQGKELDYDTTAIPVDPTSILLFLCPPEMMSSIPSLGELVLVAPHNINGFVDTKKGTKYIVAPAALGVKPISQVESPISFAGRYKDMVIFTAPSSFLSERNWQPKIHKILMTALKANEVSEGVRAVLLSNSVKVCRLILDVKKG